MYLPLPLTCTPRAAEKERKVSGSATENGGHDSEPRSGTIFSGTKHPGSNLFVFLNPFASFSEKMPLKNNKIKNYSRKKSSKSRA